MREARPNSSAAIDRAPLEPGPARDAFLAKDTASSRRKPSRRPSLPCPSTPHVCVHAPEHQSVHISCRGTKMRMGTTFFEPNSLSLFASPRSSSDGFLSRGSCSEEGGVEIVGPQRQTARVTGRKVHEPNQPESHLNSHSRTQHMPGDTERMVAPSPPAFHTSPHPTFSFPTRHPCASFPPQQRSPKTNRPSPDPGTTFTFTGTCGSRRKCLSWKRTLNWPQRKTPRTCPTRSPSLHNFRGYDSILSPSQLP